MEYSEPFVASYNAETSERHVITFGNDYTDVVGVYVPHADNMLRKKSHPTVILKGNAD